MYNDVAKGTITPLASLNGTSNKGPAIPYTGSGGTIVCVLVDDPDGQDTTFVGTLPGQFLPILIKEWVSGPADAVLVRL